MEHFLWVEKYRPTTITDTILPPRIKDTFNGFVAQKNIPNLLLTGPQGIGKTTVARALVDQVGGEYLIINGSMKGNIDTLRNEIREYASSISFTGGRKYVILDEADYLNAQSTQPALRNFMEEYSRNCGFILTCNSRNRIIKPLQSRCSVVEFALTQEEKKDLAPKVYARVLEILNKEGVEYDEKAIKHLCKKFTPDWRRVINETQRVAANGQITLEGVTHATTSSFADLIKFLKNKEFSNIRIWVGQHADIETSVLFRYLYETCSKLMDAPSAAQLVLILGKYQYQEAFVADKEINTTAALTEIMVDCSFK